MQLYHGREQEVVIYVARPLTSIQGLGSLAETYLCRCGGTTPQLGARVATAVELRRENFTAELVAKYI